MMCAKSFVILQLSTGDDKETKRDQLLRLIWEKMGGDDMWRAFCQILEENQADTECFENVLEIFAEEGTSNLYVAMAENSEAMEALRKFLRHQRIMSKSFATGFPLFYWKWHHETDPKEMLNDARFSYVTDLGDHSIEELRVYPHFKDLKEEAIATGLVSPVEFEKLVAQKASDCADSSHGRKLKSFCMGGTFGEDPLHFGIPHKAALSPRHLQAMVLYCDFTKFCTLFSESLRKLDSDDTLENVINRNAKFFYTSKSLRELVTYFGGNASTDSFAMNEYIKGPFFSGVSTVLNMSAFNIGFNAPTSTSKTAEIAWRFAGEEGMMITVGNEEAISAAQPVFNATWISKFVEEDEYFWFGSVFKLIVRGISIVSSTRVYRKSTKALYFLDAILSGMSVGTHRAIIVDEKVIRFALALLESILSADRSPEEPEIDGYVMDNLYCWRQSKTKVNIIIGAFIKYSLLMDFFFCGVEERWDVAEDRCNVISPILFDIFPNLVEIELWTRQWGVSCPFSLMSLLSVLNESQIPPSFQKLAIRDQAPSFGWNRVLINHFDAAEDIQQQYAANGWNIEKAQNHSGKGSLRRVFDWIYIQKMKFVLV